MVGLTLQGEAGWASSAWWMYTVLVDEAGFGMSSRELLRFLNAARIQTRPLWQPLHETGAHAGSQAYRCEIVSKLHRDALSLPSSVGLTPEDQQRVIESIREAAKR